MSTTTGYPPAYKITVAQTLALLDERFPGFANSIAQGEFAFWLGSGISRGRLPDVSMLIDKILDFIQSKIIFGDPNCPFQSALSEIIGIARLSPDESAHTDYSKPVSLWDSHDTIVMRLVDHYAEILDITVDENIDDYLIWEGVDVAGTFGDPGTSPDIEHYCLAILAMEGVLPDLVSANWDGLIEKAIEEIAGPGNSLIKVCVAADDFRGKSARTQILKFHGCALKATLDETQYRPFLVGRRSQITDWPNDSAHAMMRAKMAALAAEKRTLMIGLSGQDQNIQNLFSVSKSLIQWEWPVSPPAYVFAEDKLSPNQKNILSVGYGVSYVGNSGDIIDASRLPAYGKPLLTALVISVVGQKMITLANLANSNTTSADWEMGIESGIRTLQNLLSTGLESNSEKNLLRFIEKTGRGMHLFKLGRAPSDPITYIPISTSPIQLMREEQNIVFGGLPQATLALAILGAEQSTGSWTISVNDPAFIDKNHTLILKSKILTSRVYFASNQEAAISLEMEGHTDEYDGEVVVIHSSTRPRQKQRSPNSSRARRGRRTARHVEMVDAIHSSVTFSDLQQHFREAIVQ